MPWVERVEVWHRSTSPTARSPGSCCPKRYWEFEVDGRVLKAAHPRYERLYVEHVLPRVAAARAQASIGSTRTTT